jgi:hypothetical protein
MSDALTMTFKVGFRFRCTMSLPVDAVRKGALLSTECEWEPRVPTRLSSNEMRDYRRGRDAFYGEIARLTGVNIAVAETSTGSMTMTVIEPAPAGPHDD